MKHIGLYLTGLLFCHRAWPLESDLTLQQLNHTRWTVAQGAPSEVYGLAQTTDGTLWVGGARGLSRFDGIRFVHYPESADEPLQATHIATLAASPDGGLWIGFMSGGVSFLRDGHVTRYGEREGLPTGMVKTLFFDPDGTLWVAARGGLARLHGTRWQRIASESIPTTLGALVDRAGTLWVATDDRVLARTAREDHFREMAQRSGSGSGFMPLALSSNGSVWAWTKGGLTRMDSPTDPRPEGHRMLGVAGESPLLFDREGNLWLGGEAIRRVPVREPLSDSGPPRIESLTADSVGSVDAYFEDREGNIWVGTDIGLDRLSHSNILRIPLPPCTRQYALAAGDAGSLWAACPNSPSTGGVVLEIRNGTVVHQQDTAGFTAGYHDPKGAVWFGGNTGLGHIEGGRVVMTPLPEQAADNVQALVRDRTGALWVSLIHKGVFRLSGGRWSAYGDLKTLPRAPAIVETADAEGVLWLGYTDNRIARVNGDEVQLFDAGRELNVGNVTAIQASGQYVWVGGSLGFARFDGTRFVPILSASGNALTGISGIVETPGPELWLNGFNGITHISRPEVERVIRDPSHRVQVETFDALDGVPGIAQQPTLTPSAIETSDGRVWFSTSGGLVLIDPARFVRNALPPPVTVWSISSDGVRYPAGTADLHLPIHTTTLRIDYTAGSLTIPERVSFRYKLEGSDPDWQDAGNRREALYTNLAPGRYTFRVVAANNDGLWSTSSASVSFTIRPAFYQTAWFYTPCALLCLGLLAALHRVRILQVRARVRARLEERLVERERTARELHDTLVQGVQGLILSFQAITNRIPGREPARALLEQTLERADDLLGESRAQIKDLHTPASSVVWLLPRALAAHGVRLALANPAKFRVSVAGMLRKLDPIVRQEILLLGREALANAFRHAKARRIEADVLYGDTELRVRVRDNGGGIDHTLLQAGGHWGLLGMRERAKKLNAHLEIWSTRDAGTEIELRVPAEVAYEEPEGPQQRTWWRLRKRSLFVALH